jgi:hypothetical protein
MPEEDESPRTTSPMPRDPEELVRLIKQNRSTAQGLDLSNIIWGKDAWSKDRVLPPEKAGQYSTAMSTYRALKVWYQEHEDEDNVVEFHIRAWECKRKLAQQQWQGRKLWEWGRLGEIAKLSVYRLLSGYGERPWRVIASGAAVILFFALFYLPWAALDLSAAGIFSHLWKALYFSGASFTALGYGSWVESEAIAPTGWTKYLGVVESLFGVSLIALFLVTFTRKMTR